MGESAARAQQADGAGGRHAWSRSGPRHIHLRSMLSPFAIIASSSRLMRSCARLRASMLTSYCRAAGAASVKLLVRAHRRRVHRARRGAGTRGAPHAGSLHPNTGMVGSHCAQSTPCSAPRESPSQRPARSAAPGRLRRRRQRPPAACGEPAQAGLRLQEARPPAVLQRGTALLILWPSWRCKALPLRTSCCYPTCWAWIQAPGLWEANWDGSRGWRRAGPSWGPTWRRAPAAPPHAAAATSSPTRLPWAPPSLVPPAGKWYSWNTGENEFVE